MPYQCPLCKQTISRATFERVTRLSEASSKKLEMAEERGRREAAREAAPEIRGAKAEAARERKRHDRETEAWRRQVEQLREKAEARDRLHFGPESEQELFADLKRRFHSDEIELKGRGGDILHKVVDRGRAIGLIVYECKKTGAWQSAYVRQLQEAMEKHDTRYGLLVSRKLPKKCEGMTVIKDVIAVCPSAAVDVAQILRDTIVGLHRARASEEGKAAKTDALYEYLRSDDFTRALKFIDERASELLATLESEKTSHEKWWTTRSQHYRAILRNALGIDGRIQEILGTSPKPKLVRAGASRRMSA